MKTGIELIAEERKRQVEEEGWTPEHDDKHEGGSLAVAGACYALEIASGYTGKYRSEMYQQCADVCWPWDESWWKPSTDDPVRQLVKAGALIAAEIDRLQRIK